MDDLGLPPSLTLPGVSPPSSPLVCQQARTLSRELPRNLKMSKKEGFLDLLSQIEALQERLRQAYEVEQERNSERPMPPVSPRNSSGSWQRSRSHGTTGSLQKRTSFDSRTDARIETGDSAQRCAKPLNRFPSHSALLSEQTRLRASQFDAECSEQGFRLAREWDLDEEELGALEHNWVAQPSSAGKTKHAEMAVDVQDELLTRSACILHPFSTRRVMWDLFGMALIFSEVCVTPLHVYVISDAFQRGASAMEYIFTGFWLMDMVLCFRTGVYINDVLHFQPKRIAKHYLTSWFWFDLGMLIPSFLHLMGDAVEEGGVLRAIRLRRLVRMLRLMRLVRIFKLIPSLHQQFSPTTAASSVLLPVGGLLAFLILGLHLLASLWFAAGNTENGWAQLEALGDTPLHQQYLRSVEWALARLPASSLRQTVELKTAPERWLGIVATFVALVAGSIFVSVVTNAMADLAQRRRRRHSLLRVLRSYCEIHSIRREKVLKLKNAAERDHSRSSMQDDLQTLQLLPKATARELFHLARGRVLAFHPFLDTIFEENANMELILSNDAVSELYLLASDTVFSRHQKGQGLFIVSAGMMSYYVPAEFATPVKRKEEVKKESFLNIFGFIRDQDASRSGSLSSMVQTSLIRPEDYVAEPALWMSNWLHRGRLEAMVDSRALLVSTQQLHAVLKDYARLLAMAVVYARYFVESLNDLPPRDVSDLAMDPAAQQAEGSKGLLSFNLKGLAGRRTSQCSGQSKESKKARVHAQ